MGIRSGKHQEGFCFVSESEQKLDPRFVVDGHGKKIFKVMTLDDIDAMDDVIWLIGDGEKPVLQAGSVSLVFCESGTGKSFFAMHTAQCRARGMDWFGHSVQ